MSPANNLGDVLSWIHRLPALRVLVMPDYSRPHGLQTSPLTQCRWTECRELRVAYFSAVYAGQYSDGRYHRAPPLVRSLIDYGHRL